MLALKFLAAVVFFLVMWGVSTGARELVDGFGWQAGVTGTLTLIAIAFVIDWFGKQKRRPE